MSNISETLRIQLASHLLIIQKIRLLFYGQTYLGSANEQETYFTYFTLVFMLLPRTLKLICLLSNCVLGEMCWCQFVWVVRYCGVLENYGGVLVNEVG